jgi:hypothetical protein
LEIPSHVIETIGNSRQNLQPIRMQKSERFDWSAKMISQSAVVLIDTRQPISGRLRLYKESTTALSVS